VGCVNNYVLVETDRGEGDATTTDDPSGDETCNDHEPCKGTTTQQDDAAASSSDPSSSSSSSSSSSTGTPDSNGMGDTASPSTMGDPIAGYCEPCGGDAECPGEQGFCVPVAETPRCLAPCSEQVPPCPDGFACQQLQTVDRQMASLCAPVGADCPTGS
jgi:hypothetical protein